MGWRTSCDLLVFLIICVISSANAGLLPTNHGSLSGPRDISSESEAIAEDGKIKFSKPQKITILSAAQLVQYSRGKLASHAHFSSAEACRGSFETGKHKICPNNINDSMKMKAFESVVTTDTNDQLGSCSFDHFRKPSIFRYDDISSQELDEFLYSSTNPENCQVAHTHADSLSKLHKEQAEGSGDIPTTLIQTAKVQQNTLKKQE
jgi:hypothetical protein